MKLKQYVRYEMDYRGNWSAASAVFMGLSFFLRVLYYFGFINLKDIGAGEVIFSLILPLLLCGTFLVFFSLLKWNAPGLFAIAGVVFCLLLMGWNFSSGNVLRILLSIFLYVFAAVILFATALGYLPGKLPSTAVFGVIFGCRILLFSFSASGIASLSLEFSALFLLLSLLALTRCFVLHTKQ